jgi:hypothetical protein
MVDRCILFINNYEIMINTKNSEEIKKKDLDEVLYNMKIVETKMDIKEAYLLNESTRSRS